MIFVSQQSAANFNGYGAMVRENMLFQFRNRAHSR